MIFKLESGNYVISSYDTWRTGVYEDAKTAKYAFRFKDEQLGMLQYEKNKTTGVITFKDLQELYKSLKK